MSARDNVAAEIAAEGKAIFDEFLATTQSSLADARAHAQDGIDQVKSLTAHLATAIDDADRSAIAVYLSFLVKMRNLIDATHAELADIERLRPKHPQGIAS